MGTAQPATDTEKDVKEHLVHSVELLFTGKGNGGRLFMRDLTGPQYVRLEKATGIDFTDMLRIREAQ